MKTMLTLVSLLTLSVFSVKVKGQETPVADNAYNARFVTPLQGGRDGFYTSYNRPLVAQNGAYRMVYQEDGNLVLYNGNEPLWSSRSPGTARSCEFRGYGDVQLNNAENSKSMGSSGGPKPIWVLQDDGNFVGYPNYTVDTQGNVTIIGAPFAATSTAGGKKSGRSGRLN